MHASKMARLTLLLLALAAIFVGCAAGSGGSSQPSAERQAPETGNPSKAEPAQQDTDPSGKDPAKQSGHPTLGSADAPVVLTEYGDYQ
jgi:protein-disulfide isomerase